MFHYLYKTTNLINEKYYFGMHSTLDLDDNYLGSGVYLRRSIQKYGKKNFKREILEMFDSREALVQGEIDLITENILRDKQCMNCQYGGESFNTVGLVSVRDKDGNIFKVFHDNLRYLSGELQQISKGKVVAVNEAGDIQRMNITDQRYTSGTYIQISKVFTTVVDSNGKYEFVRKDDPRLILGQLKHVNSGKISVKDQHGKVFKVTLDDERYLSGEFVPFFKGSRHTKETRDKISIIEKSKVWIFNDELQKTKRVLPIKLDFFINNGWKVGYKKEYNKRQKPIWMYNDELQKVKRVLEQDINKWLPTGWTIGYKKEYNMKKHYPIVKL